MSSAISSHERILKLNRFVEANPRRSVWTLRSWIQDSTVDHSSPELIKVLHLVLSLNEANKDLLSDHLSRRELALINQQLESAITLGSQSTTSLIHEFYERCKEYQPYALSESTPHTRSVDSDTSLLSPTPSSLHHHSVSSNPFNLFARLKRVDTAQLAHVLHRERPQVIATVIAHLGAVKGAALLATFKLQEQSEICQRISALSPVSPLWLAEVERVLITESERVAVSHKTQAIPRLAELITHLPDQGTNTLLKELDEHRSTLANQLREQMFTFDDLICIEDRGIQTLLQHIDPDLLRLSLRGASRSVRDKIFKNLSERAQAMLQDDLEQLPPQRQSDVQRAQNDLVKIALDLEKKGEILIDHPLCDQSFIT